jgi:cobalt/nickel transport system permease protein
MHIPDGFLSPQTFVPAYAACGVLWWIGMRRLRATLDEETLPYVAVLTALSFVLMMVAIPLPGGTTVHAAGIALLAISFGFWMAFIAVSLVLAMQALLFGDGGVTALAVNALAMGLAGSLSAQMSWRLLKPFNETAALLLAGWISVTLPALLVALALGIQPTLAHDDAGQPLFFPFGLAVTLPAVLIPHFVIGLGEGVLTWLGWRYLTRLRERHAT